jgi:hypothetical protein
MANETDGKPAAFRLVSGPVLTIEAELQELLKTYAATVWDFTPIDGVMHCSVVLLHSRIIAQQQLMAGRAAGGMPAGLKF